MGSESTDRLSMRVWLLLVILGAFLSLVGWYRYVS